MDIRTLILTKGGSTLLMLGMCAALVWFLRFLYGPKGIFRDPQWDTAPTPYPWLEAHKEAFLAYAKEFYTGKPEDDTLLLLKQEHSLRVLDHACTLAERKQPLLLLPLRGPCFYRLCTTILRGLCSFAPTIPLRMCFPATTAYWG